MTATLLLLLAAAPLQKPASMPPGVGLVDADGRVRAPEGIRFRLPPRSTYRVEMVDGAPAYVAEAADRSGAVVVTALRSDSELPCDAPTESVTTRPYRTARGLRGCLVAAEAEDASAGMALLFVKSGEVLVSVMALATAGAAHPVATSVADSVEIDARAATRAVTLPTVDLPRAEPRLVGCFEESWSSSSAMGGGSGVTKRCFHEDLSFAQTTSVAVTTPSGGIDRTWERRGAWFYRDGVLAVAYEDGTEAEWRIAFGDEGESLVANGKPWQRL